jgi:GNAT superfamily N-acetyltransferase
MPLTLTRPLPTPLPTPHPTNRPTARPATRATTADDLAGIVAMAERCSAESLYRRFHGATGAPLRRELARTAAGEDDAHRSWLVEAGGAVRGVATLARGRDGEAHVAFLVEDAWQRRGVGRALARRLHEAARDAGLDEVVADVLADNLPVIRFAKAVYPGVVVAFVGMGESRLTIPVGS